MTLYSLLIIGLFAYANRERLFVACLTYLTWFIRGDRSEERIRILNHLRFVATCLFGRQLFLKQRLNSNASRVADYSDYSLIGSTLSIALHRTRESTW